MEELIDNDYQSKCSYRACDHAMLGALYRVMAPRELDHWLSSRMQGVEDSITRCLPDFSFLLSEIRSETVEISGVQDINGSHGNCNPWAMDAEIPGDEGTAILCALLSEYAGPLRKHAEESGLDPQLPPVSTLHALGSDFLS